MLEDEWNGLERKGRFRIQEIKETRRTSYERTHHDSINTNSRFTMTTTDALVNNHSSEIVIFTKDPKKREWIDFDDLWQVTNKEHHLQINRDSFDKVFSYIDHENYHNSELFDSISKIKTNDDSEDKMNKIKEKTQGRLGTQWNGNSFLMSPIQKTKKHELQNSNEHKKRKETLMNMKMKQPLQLMLLHNESIQFLSTKRIKPYNPCLLEERNSLSFSIVKDS